MSNITATSWRKLQDIHNITENNILCKESGGAVPKWLPLRIKSGLYHTSYECHFQNAQTKKVCSGNLSVLHKYYKLSSLFMATNAISTKSLSSITIPQFPNGYLVAWWKMIFREITLSWCRLKHKRQQPLCFGTVIACIVIVPEFLAPWVPK